MRWPGYLAENRVCNELASTLDLLPTIASLTRTELPKDRIIDGRDISNLLKDPNARSPHEYFYYYSIQSGKLNAIRDAQGFKLHLWRDVQGFGGGNPYEVNELYYLPDDINENDNIYTKRTEVVKRLRDAALMFDVELINNSRPAGHVQ